MGLVVVIKQRVQEQKVCEFFGMTAANYNRRSEPKQKPEDRTTSAKRVLISRRLCSRFGEAAGRNSGGRESSRAAAGEATATASQVQAGMQNKDMNSELLRVCDSQGAAKNETLVIYHRYIGSALLTPLGV
jgi:hypothetical protein